MKKGTILGTAIGIILGTAVGAMGANKLLNKKVDNQGGKVAKFKGYYNMLNQWLALKQQGKSLEKYFLDKGYKSIAIYGMGEMGQRLCDELKGTDIEVKYAIDKNAESVYTEIEIWDKDADEFPDADVLVVTATFAFDEIKEMMRERVECPIISLSDVFGEM